MSQIGIKVMRMVVLVLAVVFTGAVSAAQANAKPVRTLKICVAADAPATIRAAAQQVLKAVATQPLLKVMAQGHDPAKLTDSNDLIKAPDQARAFSHLILIGLPDDPMIKAAWQREARLIDNGFYIFGFGYLRGTIGYIESNRNPFLHAAAIKKTPFETEVVTLTGDTPQGVVLAVNAFLHQGLIDGVVAKRGWTRPQPCLLEHDPLPPNFSPPAWAPPRLGAATRIGWIQADDTEYRGVLAACKVEPQLIWRAKYYLPGVWDTAGSAQAYQQYLDGLHRRAYGNTLWLARFASTAQAQAAMPKIAHAARLWRHGKQWTGHSPAGDWGKAVMPLELWQHGAWLIMSTIPGVDHIDMNKR